MLGYADASVIRSHLARNPGYFSAPTKRTPTADSTTTDARSGRSPTVAPGLGGPRPTPTRRPPNERLRPAQNTGTENHRSITSGGLPTPMPEDPITAAGPDGMAAADTDV
ncbi:hypothetical protein GCM10009772_14620 [Pseudonocardia alni subsp. carboxydivorans]